MRKTLLSVLAVVSIFAACKSAPPKAGEKCKTEGIGSCPDAKHFLICRGGTWALDNCLGAGGCTAVATAIKCDQSVAAVGDHCTGTGAACSVDSKQFLKCDGTKMTLDADCKGPLACSKAGTQVKCDESAGVVGDACSDEGKAACSLDGKSFLKCTTKKLTMGFACGGAKGCHIVGDTVHCDESIGDEGDACSDPKGHACSKDKKHALECKDGKLKSMKACKKGCEIKDDQIFCN